MKVQKIGQDIKRGIQFVQESKEELKKVTWPDRDEVTTFTVITIITVVLMSLFLWMVDTGLSSLFKYLVK